MYLQENRYLNPTFTLRDMEIWMQCYYRWITILEIKNGGYPQIDLYNRMLLTNISNLQQKLLTKDFDETDDDDVIHRNTVFNQMMPCSSFFPFSGNGSDSIELIDIMRTEEPDTVVSTVQPD